MLLYAGVSMLFMVASGVAWRWARRGRRVDDHPICRKCGYDLHTFDLLTLPDCPECGTQIYSRRQLRLGNRRPRVALGRVSRALAILSLVACIGLTGEWARGYNWNHVKPTSMLIRQASDMRNPNTADAALDELDRRFVNDLLSRSQIKRLVDAALDYQADTSKPWDERWGRFLASAWLAGIASDTDWLRYVTQACRLELELREIINEGDPVVMSYEWIQPVRADDSLKELRAFDEQAHHTIRRMVDGEPVDPPLIEFTESFGWSLRYFREQHGFGLDKLPPGEYQLWVSTQFACPYPYARVAEFPSLFTKPITLTSSFEVLPQSTKLINPVHNDKLAQQAKASMVDSLQHATRGARIAYSERSGRFYVEYNIPAPSIPHWCSFDIEVYVDGELIINSNGPLGIVLEPVTTPNHYSYYSSNFRIPDRFGPRAGRDNPSTLDKFTLRLVPNPEHLKEEIDGYDYLDHTIEIRDIPIEPYRP